MHDYTQDLASVNTFDSVIEELIEEQPCCVVVYAEREIDCLPVTRRQRAILHYIRKRTLGNAKLLAAVSLKEVCEAIGCNRVSAVEDLRVLRDRHFLRRIGTVGYVPRYGLSETVLWRVAARLGAGRAAQ